MPPQNPDSSVRRALLWTLAAFALAIAIQVNLGRFSVSGMAWLSLAIASAVGGVFAPAFPTWFPSSRRALDGLLGVGTVLFVYFWLEPGDGSPISPLLPLGVILCAVLVVAIQGRSMFPLVGRFLFPALLIFQVCYGAHVILGARQTEQTQFVFHVRNDVQTFAEEADRALTAGHNPYSLRMPNVMGADMPFYSEGTTVWEKGSAHPRRGILSFGYPYLPLSALFSLPGYWLGDFRLAHLFALVAAAALLAYARPSSTSQWAAAFFLLFPPAVFVLLMSWIEPVAIFFLAATVFCYYRAPRWLFLTLGCLIASKQYTFFLLALLPLLMPEKEQRKPLLWKSVGVALLLTLPMALWDVAGFYRSVVEIQFKQPFRADSLSYLVVLLRAGGPKLSPLFAFLALLGGLWLGVKKAPASLAGWCGAGAVAYLGFFALNKQAFGNYYFWPFSLLVAAVAIALPPLGDEAAGEAEKVA